MRAVVITDTSNRTVGIEEVPDPSPGDDEVVVDVKVCGINFTDLLSLDGKYQNNPPPPFTPGKDAAGVVSAVGAGVAGLKIGDRVIAHVVHGGLAEKVACPEGLCFALPDGVAFDAAAAMGLAYQTAYHALTTRGNLQAGEIVLINGASGGVGMAAVNLARPLGASTVLAGLSSAGKADAVRAAGADAVIDLTRRICANRSAPRSARRPGAGPWTSPSTSWVARCSIPRSAPSATRDAPWSRASPRAPSRRSAPTTCCSRTSACWG